MIETVSSAIEFLLLGLGLYLANNFRRQLEMKMVDRRADAYAHLWSLMQVAGPWRLESGRGVVTRSERQEMYDQMTSWYFSGDGMYLASTTREVYLNAKFNLTCGDDKLRLKIRPYRGWARVRRTSVSAAERLDEGKARDKLTADLPTVPGERDKWRGAMSMGQLSLLRAQMKTDLEIRGFIYQDCLGPLDKAFLREAGVRFWKKPWRGSPACDPGDEPFLRKAGIVIPPRSTNLRK